MIQRSDMEPVRQAEENEVDALATIWYEGWQDAHADILPAELARLRTRESFKERLRTGLHTVRVAGPVGRPIGFCMTKDDELYQLYVSPAGRGKGVAALLEADAVAAIAARGARAAWLACAIGNDRAARFYEKMGWQRVGTVVSRIETQEGILPLEVWRYEKTLVTTHRGDRASAVQLMAFGEKLTSVKPDFGLTARDYAQHRAGFPDSLFERLSERGIGRPGQDVLDLGTGTGSVARGFARRGCNVIGLDPAESMLAKAREIDAKEALEIEYRVGHAEETHLPSCSFDVVAAGQCWHWFRRSEAATEVARLLRADGYIVIAHFDWIPLPGNVVRATEELIEKHNSEWRMGWGYGLYPAWLRDLGEANYDDVETFSYDVEVPYTPEAWRGRIRASAGVGGTLNPTAVEQFDRELAGMLERNYPEPVLPVPHRVFVVIARRPSPALADASAT